MKVRKARFEDAETIVGFQLSMALETESLELDAEIVSKGVAAVLADPARGEYWVAEVEGAVVGSLLTVPEAMHFRDEADLIAQIRASEDGLILQDGPNRGTFLPSVWESLPDPVEFLAHLKRKAGLPAHHWSRQIEIYRYQTESFGESDLA